MKLSTKERDILACAELRADLPVEKIRKETGYRDHSIRYSLRRLTDRGLIKVVPVVNVLSMGYTMHNVFFSLGSESKNLKNKIVEALTKAPEVVWLAEFGGDYQFAMGVCVRHMMRMASFLQQLSERFGNVFFEKSVASQFSAFLMPRNYLSAKKFKVEPMAVFHETPRVQVDDLDKKILSAMATSAELSHRQLALKLAMPLSTLELRVKKLRDSKVILGYTYAFDSAQAGMQHFKMLVFGKGINSQLGGRLFQFARQHKNVTMFIQTFGAWDYELNLEVERTEDVVQIRQELYEFVGNDILSVKVLPKFRDLKFITHPGEGQKGDSFAASMPQGVRYA